MHGGVEILDVEGISSNSIRISWRLEDPEDVQNMDGFYILYRRADGQHDQVEKTGQGKSIS